MIAIDPGASGGFAVHWDGTGYSGYPPPHAYFEAFSMPATEREIVELLTRVFKMTQDRMGLRGLPNAAPSAYLEELVKFTGVKMPGSYMATYASNYGYIKGVLTALGFRIVMIKPQDWQKALGLGKREKNQSKTEWKNKLKNKAEQLFPGIKVTLATADALLILEAARRGLLG